MSAAIASLLTSYFVVVSLMLGSFTNLAADRLPRHESLIRPRSHCRACGRELNVVDLLPVVGYAIRRGRCASCGTAIGPGAPLVEAVAGMSMLAPILWLGVWPGVLIGAGLVALWGVAVTTLAALRFEGEPAR